ncbi:acyl carrier protein, partial [Moorena sp. SIO3H5]|uniref:acyl carrier protein n=1 Tax=Moorena sp. SIO3H5 TaxID=2607834 RepID=UPI0013BB6B50
QTGFFDMGMDSLMAVDLKRRLELSLQQSLSTSLAFNYPTIEKLAQYLLTKIFSEDLQVNTTGINYAQQEHLDNTVITQTKLEEVSESEAEALLLQKLAILEA